jgi:Tol biopolymer transport system component
VKSDFLVDATGERVVHVALSVGATRYQVFSVAIDGSSGARQLSRASTNGYPFWPLITPDGQTVLFVSDGQLWRTPIDGMLPHIPHAAKAAGSASASMARSPRTRSSTRTS